MFHVAFLWFDGRSKRDATLVCVRGERRSKADDDRNDRDREADGATADQGLRGADGQVRSQGYEGRL